MGTLNFLEKDLETIIYEAGASAIRERGLLSAHSGSMFRQVQLNRYGIADLVNVWLDAHGGINVTVFELKQDKVDVDAFLQAVRYVRGIQTLLEDYIPDRVIKYHMVLVGRKVDTKGPFSYLTDVVNNLTVYTYDYQLDGIYFKKESNYTLADHEHPVATKALLWPIGRHLVAKRAVIAQEGGVF
jgi:hypothetical protein